MQNEWTLGFWRRQEKKDWKLTLPETAVFGIFPFFLFIFTTNLSLPGASKHGLPLPGKETAGNGLPETGG